MLVANVSRLREDVWRRASRREERSGDDHSRDVHFRWLEGWLTEVNRMGDRSQTHMTPWTLKTTGL